jgi:hypothetical protein
MPISRIFSPNSSVFLTVMNTRKVLWIMIIVVIAQRDSLSAIGCSKLEIFSKNSTSSSEYCIRSAQIVLKRGFLSYKKLSSKTKYPKTT